MLTCQKQIIFKLFEGKTSIHEF